MGYFWTFIESICFGFGFACGGLLLVLASISFPPLRDYLLRWGVLFSDNDAIPDIPAMPRNSVESTDENNTENAGQGFPAGRNMDEGGFLETELTEEFVP